MILFVAAIAAIRPPVTMAGVVLEPGSFETPPLAVGGNHICVLPGDGTVVCWGDNTFGQVGNGEFLDPSAPAGDSLVQQVVLADAAANGIPDCEDVTPDGFILRCRGSASLEDVTAIAAGYSHTCALLADTTVKCWGSNAPIDGGIFGESLTGGELGDGTTVARPFPAPVIGGPGEAAALAGVRALSAAAGYTCAVMVDGTARCWGNAPQATSSAPIPVMADAATPLTDIAAISTGDANACAVLRNGSVVCWGTGLLGDQRFDTPRDGTLPVEVTVAGDALTRLVGVEALALGHNVIHGPNGFAKGHSCALRASGEVMCWGWNDVSQLGNGVNGVTGGFDSQRDYGVPVIAAPGATDRLRGVTAIAASGYATCALMDDGSVNCWGLDFGGDSFAGAGAPVPLEIAASTTATTSGGIVLAGVRSAAIQAAAASLTNVVAIAGGGQGGMCAVLGDGSLWCSDLAGDMVPTPGVAVAAPVPVPKPTPEATPAAVPTSAAGEPTPAAGGPEAVIGEWDNRAVTITYADGLYSVTSLAPTTIPGISCQVPAGTVLMTFSGTSGRYRGQALGWSADCSTASRPATFALDGDRLTVTHELTGETVVWLRSEAAPMAGEPKTFRDSIPAPWEINLSPAVVLQTLAVAGGLIILVPFPGSLFNSTLEGNYSEIMGWAGRARGRARNLVLAPWSRLRRKLGLTGGIATTSEPAEPGTPATERGRPAAGLGTGIAASAARAAVGAKAPEAVDEPRRDFWWTSRGVGLFILITVLLSGFLDPSFGLDLASVATFVGMLLGLVVLLAAFDLPLVAFYRRSTPRIGFWLHALPATVAVSIACVLISRLTDFQPGYLYGLIIATFTAPKLDRSTEGKLMAAAVATSMAAAVVAWFGLGFIGPLANASPDPGPVLIAVQTTLSMIVVAGIELAAFGMLPLTFLVGKTVYDWNKFVWGGLWALGVLAFGIVILNPQNGYLSDTTRTSVYTVIALLAIFAIGSVAFWYFFHRRTSARRAPPG